MPRRDAGSFTPSGGECFCQRPRPIQDVVDRATAVWCIALVREIDRVNIGQAAVEMAEYSQATDPAVENSYRTRIVHTEISAGSSRKPKTTSVKMGEV